MYDQAKAAHRRILSATEDGGDVGSLFVQLSTALMCTPVSDQRTFALKRLADSCEMAMAAMAKYRQPRKNPFNTKGSP